MGTVSSLVRMVMGILTWVRTSSLIRRYHAPEMKSSTKKEDTDSFNVYGCGNVYGNVDRNIAC